MLFGLEDSWKRLSNHQDDDGISDSGEERIPDILKEEMKGISSSEKFSGVQAYRSMEAIVLKDPSLKDLLEQIKKSAVRYVGAVDSLSLTRYEKNAENRAFIESFDRNRQISHNTLIDNLNILSRECQKKGIDNKWRSVIGLNRKQVPTHTPESEHFS